VSATAKSAPAHASVHGHSEETAAPARKRKLPLLSLQTLLAEQQTLTAVDRFSQRHTAEELPNGTKYYRDLIPLERPQPGQQYAFEVDLDSCTGCKACVSACHTLNGLDEHETWRVVGLLHGGSAAAPAQQSVTSACHHCVEPACLKGCPTQAYEKDPVTGIVKHLDDQCFGCQYCTLMCPYDVPKYNPQRGIVRKCDMCSDRLAHGEAPACVRGCPNSAIAIRVVEQAAVIEAGQADAFLPGAPTAEHTLPATRYISARNVPENLLPGDYHATPKEHSHPPLVVMLTLTQLAVGAFGLGLLLERGAATTSRTLEVVAQIGFAGAALLLGLAASVFHLGRPLLAWRAVLGLRTSWLSREALVFGLFAQLAILYGALRAMPLLPRELPYESLAQALAPALGIATALTGVLGVLCSMMVYVATRRAHWSAALTGTAFFGSTLLLGAASVLTVASVFGSARPPIALLWLVVGSAVTKTAFELRALLPARGGRSTALERRASVMLGQLRHVTIARFAAIGIGGLLLPVMLTFVSTNDAAAARILSCAMLLLLLAGELLERYLFFSAAPASRMPGAFV
jgi:Fe-S-cluster-containing dehydrogenase component/DMSO reductase anchor subunit